MASLAAAGWFGKRVAILEKAVIDTKLNLSER
jgi:hypothetical protein